jgi:hypothetical protein
VLLAAKTAIKLLAISHWSCVLAASDLHIPKNYVSGGLSGAFRPGRAMSREEIIAAIQEGAARLGHVPSFAEMRRMAKLGKHTVRKHFLNYAKALEACGLERQGPGYEAQAKPLFVDWAGVVRSLGKVPTMAEYEMHGAYSVRPLIRRHGGWPHVPAGMLEFAREASMEAEWRDVLDLITDHLKPMAGQGRTSGRTNGMLTKPRILADQPIYGPPLIPAPLGLAPTNELGFSVWDRSAGNGIYGDAAAIGVSGLRGPTRGGAGPLAASTN